MTAVATRNDRQKTTFHRRLPIGAEVQEGGGAHFRIWAPRCQRARLLIKRFSASKSEPADTIALEMAAEGNGYFAAFCQDALAGDRYWFLLDDNQHPLPDPASRFQPEGPHGPSEIIDPTDYEWRDTGWKGVKLAGQVLYEMHLGTFTPEGSWDAATLQLRELAAAGITVLEVMPVVGVPGRFNWGYDGVNLYAPSQLYGRPEAMRRFVDEAHRHGLAVILDVVYNHLGPDGNYLGSFASQYFTDRHKTDWGEALNFSGPESAPVREFFIHNAGYWIDEFHLDGLRLDATQNIYDDSSDHVIAALTRQARARAGGRSIIVIGENEPQRAQLVRPPEQQGLGLDGLWNDDFHHSALVALRGRNEAYYSDFRGTAQELLSACKYGFLYQGQWSTWQKGSRGSAARDLPPWAFVAFLENHDQVSNSLRGLRLHQLSSPGRYRALTALLLLGPGTPLLFQGQEFGASTPFLFFADHHAELAPLVQKGRNEFLAQFPSIKTPESLAVIADPACEETFRRCCLDFAERERNAPVYRLHQELLKLRREEPALAPRDQRWFDGAVLTEQCFLLRYSGLTDTDERLLIVNLGTDFRPGILPEPLLAPPPGMEWSVRWSSEDPAYGGCGTPPLAMDHNWKVLGEAALWLAPQERGNG